MVELLRQGITARDIMTKEAFENAIAVVMAFGGSTNAVLHLLAIASEAEVELTLDDFARIGATVPHLADVKPFGAHVMTDVDKIGGVPVVMRALLDAGLLHGDCLTVTGRTVAENLADVAPPDPDGAVLRALDAPIHPTGGITILHGSLAPEGAVVKSAGFDSEVFEGTDACVAPVVTLTEAPHHPHMAAREVFVEHEGLVQPAPEQVHADPAQLVGVGGEDLFVRLRPVEAAVGSDDVAVERDVHRVRDEAGRRCHGPTLLAKGEPVTPRRRRAPTGSGR